MGCSSINRLPQTYNFFDFEPQGWPNIQILSAIHHIDADVCKCCVVLGFLRIVNCTIPIPEHLARSNFKRDLQAWCLCTIRTIRTLCSRHHDCCTSTTNTRSSFARRSASFCSFYIILCGNGSANTGQQQHRPDTTRCLNTCAHRLRASMMLMFNNALP